jgi:hypothetical protein
MLRFLFLRVRRILFTRKAPGGDLVRSGNHAIVPVYPKLRMSPTGLFGVAVGWQRIVRKTLPQDEWDKLHVDAKFELGGDVLAALLDSDYPSQRAIDFAERAFLSRFVGVVDICFDGHPLLTAICDATDVNRDRQPTQSTIAVIPYDDDLRDFLFELADDLPHIASVTII